MIDKKTFDKMKKKCPWFYRLEGQPKCIAQSTGAYFLRHCSKKNCAIVYWGGIFDGFDWNRFRD